MGGSTVEESVAGVATTPTQQCTPIQRAKERMVVGGGAAAHDDDMVDASTTTTTFRVKTLHTYIYVCVY